MKSAFIVAAIALLACSAFAATVTCPGQAESECKSNSSSCTWATTTGESTCSQINCDNQTDCPASCNSTTTPATCVLNTNQCEQNVSPCATGCTSGNTCTNTDTTKWDCSSFNTDATKTCTASAAFCAQTDGTTLTCAPISPQPACPAPSATVVTCAEPCSVSSSSCIKSGACDVQAPTTDNCTAANGCKFTAAAGETAATCAYENDCSAAVVNAGACIAGCTPQYSCTGSTTTFANFCTDVTTCVDATHSPYCNYANKSCSPLVAYCGGLTNTQCTADTTHCTASPTCANPDTEATCNGKVGVQANCANTCTYTAATPNCASKTTSDACTKNNGGDEATCTGVAGCQFAAGQTTGSCSTNTSGTTTSAVVIAFSSVLLATAFAL